MSVASAVVAYLFNKPELLALLGVDSEGVPYLFQDNLALEQEYLENSQHIAVVVSHVGEWDVREPSSTFDMPRVVIQVWADPDRAVNGDPVSNISARDKSLEVSKVLTKALHRVAQFDERWDDLRVLSSTQTRGPEIAPVGDGNGLVIATSYFGLVTG